MRPDHSTARTLSHVWGAASVMAVARPLALVIAAGVSAVLVALVVSLSPAIAQTEPSGEAAIVQGREALRLEDFAAALSAFEQALGDDGEDMRAALGRARALEGLGRGDEARAALDALVERAPEAGSVRMARGLLRYRAGDLEGAVEDLTLAASGETPPPLAHQRLGDALYALGQPARALEAYSRAAREPGAAAGLYRAIGNAAFALGDYDAAEAAYTEALAAAPSDGHAALHRAWTREAAGRLAAALEDYDLAMETMGGSEPRVALDRGRLLRALGAPALALDDFQTALDLVAATLNAGASGDETARLERIRVAALLGAAQSYNDLGQAQDAQARLAELQAFAPLEAMPPPAARSTRFELGRAALLARDHRRAEALFTALIDAAPERPAAYANRAQARLGLDDLSGALDDLRRAVELDPRDPAYRYALARVAAAAGDVRAAVEAAEVAERLAPNSPNGAVERARTLLALERPAAALGVVNEALALDPMSVEALRIRATALRRLGRDRDALSAALTLLQQAPRSPLAHLLAADARIALGDASGARIALNDAVGLGADPARVAVLAGEAWLATAREREGPGRTEALERAVAAFTLAIERAGGAERALPRRAVAYERLGRLEDALRDLDRAVGSTPQDPELRFARASLLVSLDRCEQALADYDAGLSLRPSNDQARSARASCRMSNGDVFGAIADYLTAFF